MTPEFPHVVEPNDTFDRVNDYFYERGWTDGLPVVPPTEERVRAMLDGMPWRNPHEVIGAIPPRMGDATMRQIAVNAVMAGCKREYLPVVVAALQAVCDPAYGLAHRQTSTHAGAPLIIVNGPIVQRLRINCGRGLFGPGWRANATIGRGLRLILVNIGGAGPAVDAAQTGHPGKYTYCIAEYEAANPWEPLHVERGFTRDQSVVTVVNAEAPHSMTENIRTDPHGIVETFASSMATLGVNNLYSQGHPILVTGIEHARHFATAGWSKMNVKQALFERARQPWGLVKDRGKSKGPRFPEFVDRNDDCSRVPIVCEARDLIVIVAGGPGGKSMYLPTAGGQSLSVSRRIETEG
ncbi:MAG: hypothetical protein OEN48_12175 [Betaproteobacteria bacterium]|nr:hypothetical protein [Gammaproteobacteria bacterium]MDH3437730.1 hypothetical protein [Betaproteobacteria bacterium]